MGRVPRQRRRHDAGGGGGAALPRRVARGRADADRDEESRRRRDGSGEQGQDAGAGAALSLDDDVARREMRDAMLLTMKLVARIATGTVDEHDVARGREL